VTKSSERRTAGQIVAESFRLVSVASTTTPRGGAGDDWLTYRIAQGKNLVTGYRRGGRHRVTADIECIVEALNERLLVNGRRYRSVGRAVKSPLRHKDLG
jgi:hypothetical protein